MSDVRLGCRLYGHEQRDAIHVAIAPVVADEPLNRGQRLDFVDGSNLRVKQSGGNGIGIVDPWLMRPIEPGESFYMLLHPGTVTGMRHHWSHPAFDHTHGNPASESEQWLRSLQWLRSFAEGAGLSCEDVLDAARTYAKTGRDYCFGHETPDAVYERGGDFWRHANNVLGTNVSDDYAPFRCAC